MPGLTLVRPVPYLDALAALHGAAAPFGLFRKAAALQAAVSETVGLALGGDLIVVAGFLPLSRAPAPPQAGRRPVGDEYEFWLAIDARARPHLARILRLARLTFAGLPDDALVVAHVREGHRPGARLASLAGFSLAGTAGGFERWERRGERDRESHLRRRRRGQTGRAAAPAR